MPSINFLPAEQVRSKQVTATGRTLKLIVGLLGVLCLVGGIGGTAYILYMTGNINTLTKQNDELKAQVLAQESSEQALVLLRDRLTKIRTIDEKYQSNKRVAGQKEVFDELSPDASLAQMDLTSSDATVAFSVKDSTTLASIIDLYKKNTKISSSVDAISFNDTTFYRVNFLIR